MRQVSQQRAFTLIEVLVVVAIIALLVAILLPSLSRARAQARMVTCQSNIKQLDMAFQMYAVANMGRLPGHTLDPGSSVPDELDWLGASNSNGGKPMIYGPSGRRGRMPEWGTVWRYMNKQKYAYMCPDDRLPRTETIAKSTQYYSFTANLMLNGAKPESVMGAHYPLPVGTWPFTSQLNRLDHRKSMGTLDGAPMIVEEDENFYLNSKQNDDGRWSNGDTIAPRHLATKGKRGYANLGYVDGHVGRIEGYALTPNPVDPTAGPQEADFLQAQWFCIRRGRTWVSGRDWPYMGFKYMDEAKDASAVGVQH